MPYFYKVPQDSASAVTCSNMPHFMKREDRVGHPKFRHALPVWHDQIEPLETKQSNCKSQQTHQITMETPHATSNNSKEA